MSIAHLLTIVGTTALASAQSSQNLTTIALSGQPAPGTEAGVVFDRFSPPALAEDGSVVFFATLSGDNLSTDRDEGVFLHQSDTTSLIVRESDPAPWYAPDTRFVGLSDYSIDASGMLVLSASVDDPAVGDATAKARALGVFTQVDAGVFVPLARIGEQAAGLPDGELYDTLHSPGVDGDGRSFFTGGREGDEFQSLPKGLWSDRSGTTTLLVAPGDAAPGTADGVFVHLADPVPLASGGFVLGGGYRPAGTTDPAVQGLWRETQGMLQAVALAGDPAPGTTGHFVLLPSEPAANASGVLAFHATVDTGNPLDDEGLWSDRNGSLSLIVREGDAAPGIAGATIGTISPQIALNDAGDIAFRCVLLGPGTSANSAIYLARADGSISLVAREGDGLDDEVQSVRLASLGDPLCNNAGQMVFRAFVRGSSVKPATNEALVGVDASGRVFTIVREGEPLDPDGQGVRTIGAVSMDTSHTRRGREALDASGRVGFVVHFADDTFGVMTAPVAYTSPADFDGDGIVSTADFVLYLNAWNSRLPEADLNLSGQVNTADYIAYLNFWSEGRG